MASIPTTGTSKAGSVPEAVGPPMPIDRSRAFSELEAFLQMQFRDDLQPALLLVNIDRLRQLNLSHGLRRVDALLRHLESRMHALVSGKGLMWRVGNADYLLALPAIRAPGHARLAATRLQRALSEVVWLEDDGQYHVNTATGFLLPGAEECIDLAIIEGWWQQLERALLLARQSSLGVADPDQLPDSDFELLDWDIERDLRQAIELEQLAMYYQPQQSLQSGAVVAAEALLRWRNGERGFIRPDLFIPVAERGPLIEEITRWTLNTTVREISRMPEALQPERVSVNLSARLLGDMSLLDDVEAALSIWGMEPRRLVLEITETALIDRLQDAIELLQALRRLGVGLSIDDFGTGYSSMTYLRRLPATELKIDRSFVNNLCDSLMDRHIVKSLIHMAHDLELQVVAEGVEDEATQARLVDLGCDIVQGYHLARPMPMEELETWMSGRRA